VPTNNIILYYIDQTTKFMMRYCTIEHEIRDILQVLFTFDYRIEQMYPVSLVITRYHYYYYKLRVMVV